MQRSRRVSFRWCLKHWQDWQGETIDAPACVVRPRNAADVQAVVRFAAKHTVPIVPWGLGSGVLALSRG